MTPYSITEHGGALLARNNQGEALPTMVVDLAQRAVFNANGCPLSGESLPGTVVLSFPHDTDPKLPWSCTAHQMIQRLCEAIDTATPGLAEEMARCYPDRRLSRVSYIVLEQPAQTDISADEALAVIEAIRADGVDPELKSEAEEMLIGAGVTHIPDAPTFNGVYHLTNKRESGQLDGCPIRILHPGWSMKGRVLIKSLVEIDKKNDE